MNWLLIRVTHTQFPELPNTLLNIVSSKIIFKDFLIYSAACLRRTAFQGFQPAAYLAQQRHRFMGRSKTGIGKMLHFTVLLFMLAVGLPAAIAHPTYFHERQIAKTCTEHPLKAAGGHLPPVADS